MTWMDKHRFPFRSRFWTLVLRFKLWCFYKLQIIYEICFVIQSHTKLKIFLKFKYQVLIINFFKSKFMLRTILIKTYFKKLYVNNIYRNYVYFQKRTTVLVKTFGFIVFALLKLVLFEENLTLYGIRFHNGFLSRFVWIMWEQIPFA